MKWLMIVLSLYGNYLNVKKHVSSFIIWVFVDFYFCQDHFMRGDYEEAVLFFVYSIFAAYGALEWTKTDHIKYDRSNIRSD